MEPFKQYFLGTIKKKYADFDGRATRSEFWYYTLFYAVIAIALATIDQYVLNPILGMPVNIAANGGLLQIIFALALVIPSLAVGIRRLHDIGKSGWWTLVALVPLLGIIVLLYFYVQKSQ